MQSGLYVLDVISGILRGTGRDRQARAVLALPFFTQELILEGGVGPATKRITERYTGITVDEVRELAGALEPLVRREGYGDPSGADARRAIRDAKGASLAGAELLAREGSSDDVQAYMMSLEEAAASVNAGKATKAELGAVARLLELQRPEGARSWGSASKAAILDAIEDQLSTELNPARPWTDKFRRPWSPRDPDYVPNEHLTSYKYGGRPGYPQLSGNWSDLVAFDLGAPITKKEKEALDEVMDFFRTQETMGRERETFKPNTSHGRGFHYRVWRSLVGKGFLDYAPEGYDEGRPDWSYTGGRYDVGGLIPGQRKLPQRAAQLRLFNPAAALDGADLSRVG